MRASIQNESLNRGFGRVENDYEALSFRGMNFYRGLFCVIVLLRIIYYL